LAKKYLKKSQHPGQNDGLKATPQAYFSPPPHKSAGSESKQPSSACGASYGVPQGPFDVSIKEGFIRLLYDFMGVLIGEICDMMSDIIGLLSDIIGLWWVLKSKNDTNQKDAQ
jgi:hypothetical protein